MPVNNACCGCTGCLSSGGLVVASPATIQAVISGVTLCATGLCTQFQDGFSSINSLKVQSGSINGTYCLTPTTSSAQNCVYIASLATPIVIDYWYGPNPSFNNSCAGAKTGTVTITSLRATFSQGLGASTLNIEAVGTDSLFGFCAFLFNVNLGSGGNVNINPNCVDGTYSQTLNGCGSKLGVTPLFGVASGGQVSLVMNGC